MNENNGTEETLTPQEDIVDLDTTESTDETTEQIDWKAEALKMKEIADNQRIRAEKAERKTKETPQSLAQANPGLSTADIIALSKSDIEAEDIDEVLDYAKFKRISVSEALKSPVVKATLAEKKEQRNVAIATNTGGAKRSAGRISDETLISNADKGILPESDADIDRLMKAKMFAKK